MDTSDDCPLNITAQFSITSTIFMFIAMQLYTLIHHIYRISSIQCS